MIKIMSKTNNLGEKVFSGFAWRFLERILAQGVTFVVSLILARLLMPSDYGVISLIMVFITIANIFITDGFCAALIQKKECDELDFSSVLYGGFVMSVVIYIFIYIFAPFVAQFYNLPILTPVLRVLALRIPLASINSVESAYLSKRLEFKKFFWATFGGTMGSAVAGIIAAYHGLGVWALVIQNLFNYTVDTIILAIVIKKKPLLSFSMSRMVQLLKYGYKILVTNLLFTVVDQLRTIIIGKFYSTAQLAFYSKGKHFPELVSNNLTAPISSVVFPAMSTVQDDICRVREMMRKSMKIISYVIPPLLLGFGAVSKPFVSLVLTDKWLPCIPYIWLGCIYYIFPPLHSINLEAVKAVGRSDQVLKYGIIKRSTSIITLVIAIPFGIMAIALSLVANAVISTFINAYQNKKLFNYSYKTQFFDIFGNILSACFMCVVTIYIGRISLLNNLLTMFVQIVFGIVIFIITSFIAKNESMYICINMIKSKIRK